MATCAERIPQSTAIRVAFIVRLTTSGSPVVSDHYTVATGKTVAITISKNGAAFGNPSAGATNATEIANGWYYVDLSTTDTATLGPLIVRGTATNCDDVGENFRVVDADSGGYNGTLAELTQATPPANPTRSQAQMLNYMAVRNKVTVTGTQKSFYNDAGTLLYKKTIADDGTEYTESEAVSGP